MPYILNIFMRICKIFALKASQFEINAFVHIREYTWYSRKFHAPRLNTTTVKKIVWIKNEIAIFCNSNDDEKCAFIQKFNYQIKISKLRTNLNFALLIWYIQCSGGFDIFLWNTIYFWIKSGKLTIKFNHFFFRLLNCQRSSTGIPKSREFWSQTMIRIRFSLYVSDTMLILTYFEWSMFGE